jgi:hypothetical protein
MLIQLTHAGRASASSIDDGTSESDYMTPKSFVDSKRNIRYLVFPLVAPNVDVGTGTNVFGTFTMQFSGTIIQDDTDKTKLMVSTTTAGSGGTMTVDIHKNGTTIMDTNKITIDSGEETSETAATQPDLSTTTVAAGDKITWDIDAAHSTPAKECKGYMAIRED